MFVTPEALAAVLESTAKDSVLPILEAVALCADASHDHAMAAFATDRYQVSKFVPEGFDGALESPTEIISRETATAIIKSKAQAEIDTDLHTATLVTGAVLPLLHPQRSYLVPSNFPNVTRFFPDAKDFAPKMDYGISVQNINTVTKNIAAYNRAVSKGKRVSGFQLRFFGGTESPKAIVDITDEFSMLLMEWARR